jgi:hypothetical protein
LAGALEDPDDEAPPLDDPAAAGVLLSEEDEDELELSELVEELLELEAVSELDLPSPRESVR